MRYTRSGFLSRFINGDHLNSFASKCILELFSKVRRFTEAPDEQEMLTRYQGDSVK